MRKRTCDIGGIRASCVLTLLFVCLPIAAEQNTVRADINKALIGRVLTSRIALAGTGSFHSGGYTAGGAYPINTLFYPDTGFTRYRIEEGLLRGDVDDKVAQKFEIGHAFRVEKVALKNDKLIIRLRSQGGESALLKLMLGRGWQRAEDVSSVLIGLNRALNLDAVGQFSLPTSTDKPNQPLPNTETALDTNVLVLEATTTDRNSALPPQGPSVTTSVSPITLAAPKTDTSSDQLAASSGNATGESVEDASTFAEDRLDATEPRESEPDAAKPATSSAEKPSPAAWSNSAVAKSASESPKSPSDSDHSFVSVAGTMSVIITVVWIRKRIKQRNLEKQERQREEAFRRQLVSEVTFAKAQYQGVIDEFDTFVRSCKGSWADFVQMLSEFEGKSREKRCFEEIVNVDVVAILKKIVSATGDRARCARLYQAVSTVLLPYQDLTVDVCVLLLETSGITPIKTPLMVEVFTNFSDLHGTNAAVRLSRSAASAFKALIVAAFDGKHLSAKANSLREQYLKLLEPYLQEAESSGYGSASENPKQNNSIDNPKCQKCSQYYDLLQLDANADKKTIQAAYRIRTQIYHPDRFHANELVRQTAENEMKRVNVAYSHLMEHIECSNG